MDIAKPPSFALGMAIEPVVQKARAAMVGTASNPVNVAKQAGSTGASSAVSHDTPTEDPMRSTLSPELEAWRRALPPVRPAGRPRRDPAARGPPPLLIPDGAGR